MAKRNDVYKCPECGNIVEVLVGTDKELCGFLSIGCAKKALRTSKAAYGALVANL